MPYSLRVFVSFESGWDYSPNHTHFSSGFSLKIYCPHGFLTESSYRITALLTRRLDSFRTNILRWKVGVGSSS